MDDKDAYREKAKARLDQWRAEIDKLQAKAAEASADTKIEYEKQLQALRDKQQEMRQQLDELGSASGDAWKDIKAGLDAAWDDLESSVKNARERFG